MNELRFRLYWNVYFVLDFLRKFLVKTTRQTVEVKQITQFALVMLQSNSFNPNLTRLSGAYTYRFPWIILTAVTRLPPYAKCAVGHANTKVNG